MGGHGHVGRAADDLVADAPLPVGRIAARQVQRSGHDADRGVAVGESAAKVLEVGPVVAVKALALLGAHVGEQEGRVHGTLRPLGVGGRHLVPAVVAGAEVVGQLGAMLLGHGLVLDEVRVPPIALVHGQGGGREVLGDPMRVPRASVEARDGGRRGVYVGHGTGESILEQTVRVDQSAGIFLSVRRDRRTGKSLGGDSGRRGGCGSGDSPLARCDDGCSNESARQSRQAGDDGSRLGHIERALLARPRQKEWIRDRRS